MPENTNDFDVAKAIFEQLHNLEADRRQRILRWVSESLGVTLPVKNSEAAMVPAEGLVPHDAGPAPPKAPSTGKAGAIDIKTFVDSKKPNNDVKFATVVAHYYRFEAPEDQRKERITQEILQEGARQAGRKRFKNPLGTLNNAKRLGYLDSAGRGAFKINTVGENLVVMTLPGGQGDSRRAAIRRQRGKQGSKGKQ